MRGKDRSEQTPAGMDPADWITALNGVRTIVRTVAEVKEAAKAEGFSDKEAFELGRTWLAETVSATMGGRGSE